MIAFVGMSFGYQMMALYKYFHTIKLDMVVNLLGYSPYDMTNSILFSEKIESLVKP